MRSSQAWMTSQRSRYRYPRRMRDCTAQSQAMDSSFNGVTLAICGGGSQTRQRTVSQSSMHPTTSKYKLAFMEVNNDGMSSKQIEQRIKKEKTSLEHFNKLKELKLKTMDDLHKFIMLSHKAYSFQTDEEIIQRRKNDLKSTQAVLDTY